MRLLVYKGDFQYGVLNFFIDYLIEAFISKNHEIIVVDLTKSGVCNEIIEIFSTKSIDCVISFGSIGVDLSLDNNELIYNIVNTTFLGIYVDHPVSDMDSIVVPVNNYLISFIDKNHVSFINEIFPDKHKISFFLPHGGLSLEENSDITFDMYLKEKEIDVLFSGTYMGKPSKFWANNSFCCLLDEICEILIYDDYASLHETFKYIFEKEGIKFSSLSKSKLHGLYQLVITYVRQKKRDILIKKLIESGLKIVVCGNNWDNFFDEYDNVDYKGGLDIKETLRLISKSKILINATPNFINGSHERVFTGMLNHTVVFSDRSKYYDEYFEEGDTILYYSFNTLENDIMKLKSYLNNNKKLFEMSQKAYSIVKKEHTWSNRADKILQMIELSKVLSV